MSHKKCQVRRVLQECQVRVSYKSVKQECLTRVSNKSVYRSVKQGCLTRVSSKKCLTRVSRKKCLQECQVSLSHKSVTLECLTRVSKKSVVSRKSVLQECQVRVSHKSVKQESLTRALRNSVKQGCPTKVSPQCVNSGCLTSEFAGNVTNKYCLCLSTYVSAFGFVGFILFSVSGVHVSHRISTVSGISISLNIFVGCSLDWNQSPRARFKVRQPLRFGCGAGG